MADGYATCSNCGKDIAVCVPKGGDGSVAAFHRHKGLTERTCPGCWDVIDWKDVRETRSVQREGQENG